MACINRVSHNSTPHQIGVVWGKIRTINVLLSCDTTLKVIKIHDKLCAYNFYGYQRRIIAAKGMVFKILENLVLHFVSVELEL